MVVPQRNALCLECRTALFDQESCDMDGKHPVSSMADIYGREMLVTAVWGPLRTREQNHRAATRSRQALTALASLGGMVGLLGTWLLAPVPGILPLLGGVASGAMVWYGGNKVAGGPRSDYPMGAADNSGAYHGAVRARGSGSWPQGGQASLGRRGTVEGERVLESPAAATRCVAYALELHFAGSGIDRVMYRDAVTAGFDVQLDGGRIARIPPGRIRLLGTIHQEIDVDNVHLERYLARFDPRHRDGDAFDPLRHNVVCEQVILPGDRIELLSPFDPMVNARARPTHYRIPAPSLLTPRGVPVIRLPGA